MKNLKLELNNKQLVSVIIPTFNRKELLQRAINSVVNQTYENWEIIVIDNFSTDATKDYISRMDNSKIKFFQIRNKGIVAKSRNFGISKSSGEFIAFLDSDDWWHKEKLEDSLKFLNTGADIIYHDLYYRTEGLSFINLRTSRNKSLTVPVKETLIKNGCVISNSSVVVRKSIGAKVGFLSENPNFKGWEDFEFYLRLSQVTERFFRIPRCLGYYWIGDGNLSSNHRLERKILINMKKVIRRELNLSENYEDTLPSWLNYLIFSYAIRNKGISIMSIAKRGGNLSKVHLTKLIFRLLKRNLGNLLWN
jgi:glycosyltransferase involved in cell wall biosynthesis